MYYRDEDALEDEWLQAARDRESWEDHLCWRLEGQLPEVCQPEDIPEEWAGPLPEIYQDIDKGLLPPPPWSKRLVKQIILDSIQSLEEFEARQFARSRLKEAGNKTEKQP